MRHLSRVLALSVAFVWSSQRLNADPPHVSAAPWRDPAGEKTSFRLPPGFEMQLVVSEPEIQKPINMAFDARGRLWVTSTRDYPYPAADGNGTDSIKILEDFGPDGRARKVTTFADKLNIPIGILPYGDGVIAFSIPNIWYLRDTDGDGVCDKREIVLSGFGKRDTHGMVNGFALGFDGWVYACHGFANDSEVTAKDGSKIVMNSGNTFRFKPDGSRVEIVARGQVNPFGQTVDPEGNFYTACCHSKPITQLMRGAVYPSFAKPHDGMGFGPDMIPQYDGSTALCGLVYYAADNFPVGYRNGMVLGDVVNTRINYFLIDRKGASYTALQQPDLVTSDDPWFRPVDIKLGPDGALYVADFYNRIIGHYEVPLDHPGRDRTSGRVWRIVYRGNRPETPPADRTDWTKASADELIAALKHPNLMIRLTATQQLVERGEAVAKPIHDLLTADTANPVQTAHGLWVLERLGKLDAELLRKVNPAHHPLVDIHRLRIISERAQWTDGLEWPIVEAGLTHADPLVVRTAVQAMYRDPSDRCRKAILAKLAQPSNDGFLTHALRLALREQFRGQADWDRLITNPADQARIADIAIGLPEPAAGTFLAKHMNELASSQSQRVPEFLRHVARFGTPADLESVSKQLDAIAADPAGRVACFRALHQGAQEGGRSIGAECTAYGTNLAKTLLTASAADAARRGVDVAQLVKKPELAPNLLALANDRGRPEALRVAAYGALLNCDTTAIPTAAARLLDSGESPILREGVAKSLAEMNQPQSRQALVDAIKTAPSRLASSIAAGLASTEPGAGELCEAVATGKVSPRLLTERAVQVKLNALRSAGIKNRVTKLTQGLPPADAATASLLKERLTDYAKQPHDASAGAKVFTKHCANCHQVAGQGAKVGPQLDGVGVRGLERLLEDVLDPNRNVDQSFRTTNLLLKNGRSLSGLLLREEGRTLVLADNEGKEQRVSLDEVDTRDVLPVSPMPPNWAQVIPPEEFHDLMAYLLSLKVK